MMEIDHSAVIASRRSRRGNPEHRRSGTRLDCFASLAMLGGRPLDGIEVPDWQSVSTGQQEETVRDER